jgi:hypothetical protein
MISFLGNKKATSPFFAVIMLFAFALIIGFILTTIDPIERQSEDSCSGFENIKLLLLNDKPRICYSSLAGENNTIEFLMENNAGFSVEGVHVTTIGDSQSPVFVIRDYNTLILSGGTNFRKYFYPKSIGNLTQVKIAVYKKQANELVLCQKPSIIISSVKACIS